MNETSPIGSSDSNRIPNSLGMNQVKTEKTPSIDSTINKIIERLNLNKDTVEGKESLQRSELHKQMTPIIKNISIAVNQTDFKSYVKRAVEATNSIFVDPKLKKLMNIDDRIDRDNRMHVLSELLEPHWIAHAKIHPKAITVQDRSFFSSLGVGENWINELYKMARNTIMEHLENISDGITLNKYYKLSNDKSFLTTLSVGLVENLRVPVSESDSIKLQSTIFTELEEFQYKWIESHHPKFAESVSKIQVLKETDPTGEEMDRTLSSLLNSEYFPSRYNKKTADNDINEKNLAFLSDYGVELDDINGVYELLKLEHDPFDGATLADHYKFNTNKIYLKTISETIVETLDRFSNLPPHLREIAQKSAREEIYKKLDQYENNLIETNYTDFASLMNKCEFLYNTGIEGKFIETRNELQNMYGDLFLNNQIDLGFLSDYGVKEEKIEEMNKNLVELLDLGNVRKSDGKTLNEHYKYNWERKAQLDEFSKSLVNTIVPELGEDAYSIVIKKIREKLIEFEDKWIETNHPVFASLMNQGKSALIEGNTEKFNKVLSELKEKFEGFVPS